MKAKRVHLVVTRQEKTGGVFEGASLPGIYEHEKQILEELYGSGNVDYYTAYKTKLAGRKGRSMYHEQTEEVVEFPVVLIDEEPEYARLAAKYDRHPDQDVLMVEFCFGRQNEHRLEAFGEKMYKNEKGIDEQEWIESQRQREENDGSEGWKRKYEFSVKSLAQLRNLCKTYEVPYDKGDTKGIIINKLVAQGASVGD